MLFGKQIYLLNYVFPCSQIKMCLPCLSVGRERCLERVLGKGKPIWPESSAAKTLVVFEDLPQRSESYLRSPLPHSYERLLGRWQRHHSSVSGGVTVYHSPRTVVSLNSTHRNDESRGRELESRDVVSILGQEPGLFVTLSGQDFLVEVGAASTILGLNNSTQLRLKILL